ncbi:hypothetical protein L6164_003859 [Bauhinia variegata]|nr:hypothetical protein L6164_003859 [Bauhinia variegata]
MDKSGDPRIEAADDPKLSTVACPKVLVMVAGKDTLRDRGLTYYEALKKSGWRGTADIVEAPGEDHVFHLLNPDGENAVALLKQFVSFME